MFKRLMTIMLVCSVLASQAMARPQELRQAFNELNYALNVEWDQVDQDFYAASTNQFMAAIQQLALTPEQLIEFIQSEITDQRLALDVSTALHVIDLKKFSPAEAAEYMQRTLESNLQTGASWHGSATVRVMKALVVYAVAVVVVRELNQRANQ
jgi:hypothetical protein